MELADTSGMTQNTQRRKRKVAGLLCSSAMWAAVGVFAFCCDDPAAGQTVANSAQRETQIAGKACTVGGEGSAGATLWLEYDADTAALEVMTGADGKYECVVARGGRFKLKVMKHGFREAGVDPIQVDEGRSK